MKDIAAHLLDGNIRTLSLSRDKHVLVPGRNIDNYRDLVDYLNSLNAEWVIAMKRMSPSILTELLEVTGKEYSKYIASLDPHADAIFPVAWAGEHVSKNWFHVAREYTEKWHHQQQIREATGKPGIMTKKLFYPVLNTFMRGLPHTFRNTSAAEETAIEISVDSEAGGKWFLVRRSGLWQISSDNDGTVSASITIPAEISWKLFTKGISPEEAGTWCTITGDGTLGATVLSLVAVMA